MTLIMLGFALITSGASLAFSVSILADKPALSVMALSFGCIAAGCLIIRSRWPAKGKL